MTQLKEQSGGLTAAEQERKDFAADIDYWRLFGVEIIHWTEIAGAYLCRAEKAEVELQRMKAVLRDCASELHYAVDMQDDYIMTDAGRRALKQADEILNAALLTDTPAGTKEGSNGL